MSDLHEWLAAARLDGYEALVREYAGDLDDIAELTPATSTRSPSSGNPPPTRAAAALGHSLARSLARSRSHSRSLARS